METVNLVKIGSNSVNEANSKRLLDDIKLLEESTGEKFMILSSGSVKLGADLVNLRGGDSTKLTSASLSSIGQSQLMGMYDRLSGSKIVSQILLDDYVNECYIDTFVKKLRDLAVVRAFASKILRPC